MSRSSLDTDDEDENDSILLNFEPLRKRRKPSQAPWSGRPSVASNSEVIEIDDYVCASVEPNTCNKETNLKPTHHRKERVFQSGKPLHVDRALEDDDEASGGSESVMEMVGHVNESEVKDDSSCDTKELAWKIMHPNLPYPKPSTDSAPAARVGVMNPSMEAAAAASPADDFCLPEQESSSSSCSVESEHAQDEDAIELAQCSDDPTPIPRFVSLGPRDGNSSTPAHPITTQIRKGDGYLQSLTAAKHFSQSLSSCPNGEDNHDENAFALDHCQSALPFGCQTSDEEAFFPEEDHAFDRMRDQGHQSGGVDDLNSYEKVDHRCYIRPSTNVRKGLHPQRHVLTMQNQSDMLLKNQSDMLLTGEEDIENFSDEDQHVFSERSYIPSSGNSKSSRMNGPLSLAWQPFPRSNDPSQPREVESPENPWQAVAAADIQQEPSNNGSFEETENLPSNEQYTHSGATSLYANNGASEVDERDMHGRRIIRNVTASNTTHVSGIILPRRSDAHVNNHHNVPNRNDLTGGSGVEASSGGGLYSFVSRRPPSQVAHPSNTAMLNGISGDATFGDFHYLHDYENQDSNLPETGSSYKASRSTSRGRGSSAQRGRRGAGRGGFRKKRSWDQTGRGSGRGRGNHRATASGNGGFRGRRGRGGGGTHSSAGRGSGATTGRDDPNLGHIGGADINF